jgi:4-hydroxy-3-polyprenylbenzoate decarboxylase
VRPSEILTIANRILGTGQLSLAKFLFITAGTPAELTVDKVEDFFRFVFERFKPERDVHFQTQTTIDTLDYSGEGLNSGSKVIFAAYGEPVRKLSDSLPDCLLARGAKLVFPGVCVLPMKPFSTYNNAQNEMDLLNDALDSYQEQMKGVAMIVAADDPDFVAKTLNNFLWVSFTRCNPAYDIYGINCFYDHKHWGCTGQIILDARAKPHHAPVLQKDEKTERSIDRLFTKGGSLHGIV